MRDTLGVLATLLAVSCANKEASLEPAAGGEAPPVSNASPVTPMPQPRHADSPKAAEPPAEEIAAPDPAPEPSVVEKPVMIEAAPSGYVASGTVDPGAYRVELDGFGRDAQKVDGKPADLGLSGSGGSAGAQPDAAGLVDLGDGGLDMDDRPRAVNGPARSPEAPEPLMDSESEAETRRATGRRDERSKGENKKELAQFARRDGDMVLIPPDVDAQRFVRPPSVLPRIFYFENTYLGGSAAYAERLRRLASELNEGERHYRQARAEVQPFDPPFSDGLGVTAIVDANHIDQPQRVFLQVGIQGSDRYGWRRPPLDVALVVDPSVLARNPGVATRFVIELLRKLGTADRLAIVVAGSEPETFLTLARTPSAQQHLAQRIDRLEGARTTTATSLSAAMDKAGQILRAASDDEAVVPGSQSILVLTGLDPSGNIGAATSAAHELTVQGAVTSVFTLDVSNSAWWQVANAGYGNFHRIDADGVATALDEELASLARVVARLVRVNIRLGKDAHAIRVLGTRVLDQAEVAAVKAREVATDINLSKTMGIVSDRGEDDDGIQTVIPYFYGDDSHVILVELWVEKPGLVADVTVRYKDMVNLDNATARTSVKLAARPQTPTREQALIAQNVRGFLLAESLQKASNEVSRGDAGNAVRTLQAARAMATTTNPEDLRAVDGLKRMVERGTWQYDANARATLEESLLISGQRRVGDTDRDE